MKINLKFLLYIILLQILISFSINIFYYADSNDIISKLKSVPLILSCLFIIASFILSLESSWNATFMGIIGLLPFLILVLMVQFFDNLFFNKTIANILSFSFLHLGGFRSYIYKTFGFKALYNTFYAMNITIFIHMMGFVLGDVLHFIMKGKKRYV